MPDYLLPTRIYILGYVFQPKGPMDLRVNSVTGREVILETSAGIPLWNEFDARVLPWSGRVQIESDRPDLWN